ncbi:MAG: 3-deoxy-D-manno-octulosonic acid transferase [Proteobacteria bacterium]|nr:3-deoxy-D-manno-octulosonic acid transferase [Pseudomonadota bacterium]MBU1709805.1 3-deoxy-D-manno-octulosonic acid transferase [Pseudomonadota bacterium]
MYNVIQWVFLAIFFPVLALMVLVKRKYRGRILFRLGFGIDHCARSLSTGTPVIWIHALSVGEVSSCQTLVKAIRNAYPRGTVILSTTTRSGEAYARNILAGSVDLFLPYPLDILWSVRRVVSRIRPDLFILVETDFWPNLLHELKIRGIPSILVNGRISADSFTRYKRFKWFFLPMFKAFKLITMQTENDCNNMIELGVDRHKVLKLGNLKFDAVMPGDLSGQIKDRSSFGIPDHKTVIVAGSTHAGEEEIILRVFRKLITEFPDLFLIIAPRNVERGKPVTLLARQEGFIASRRQEPMLAGGNLLVLDTLGELAGVYSFCDIAFVGGSLVQQGGHNPLEPAVFGKPVLFGPDMNDFLEIAQGLLNCAGALLTRDEAELFEVAHRLLKDKKMREEMGRHAAALVAEQRGVTARHVEMLQTIMGEADN